MSLNWLHLGAVIGVGAVLTFAFFVRRAKPSALALGVGAVNMIVVLLHVVAPVRGLMDPAYRGYSFGWVRVEQGPMVTLVAGTTFLAALAAACLAVRSRQGRGMILVAGVDALIFCNMAASLAAGIARGRGFEWQFGEFLTIPSAIGFVLTLGVLVLPFAMSSLWAASRWRPT